MARARATLKVTRGPNKGDAVSLDPGSCRLVGRHLSEHETVMIDRDGNRLLDGEASKILVRHLADRAPPTTSAASEGFSINAFERGADIILADDSISRAHAMVFMDEQGLGIIDLASTNGTRLNGQPVGTARVQDGDVVSIGNSELALSLR